MTDNEYQYIYNLFLIHRFNKDSKGNTLEAKRIYENMESLQDVEENSVTMEKMNEISAMFAELSVGIPNFPK